MLASPLEATEAPSPPSDAAPADRVIAEGVAKTFTLHAQGGVRIPVMRGAGFRLRAGECAALTGVSGSGKSTLMRLLYGNYRAQAGAIWVRGAVDAPWLDVIRAEPHDLLELRRVTLGHVSQFLRVIPRVSTLEVVAEPLIATGRPREAALERARALLSRLRIPETLWSLSPLTFSGGEQQRVNLARGFAHDFPILLLDEPTASLDRLNRETVMSMIEEAKADGRALIGIFHDVEARERICDREVDVAGFTAAAQ